MQWVRASMAAYALTGVLWLIAVFVYGSELLTILGMFLIIASGVLGIVFARGRLVSLWLALVLLGVFLFFVDNFIPLRWGAGAYAVVAFLVMMALLTIVTAVQGVASTIVFRVAALGAALPGVAWLWIDGNANALWWEPGNLTAVIAPLLLFAASFD